MAHLGTGVEYALHCLLWIAQPLPKPPSSRELAALQGAPAPFVAKIFGKLEKAGLVEASIGIRGGYRLARAPEDITVLDVVDAVEGRKNLFDCQNVRSRCALYEGQPPDWSAGSVCGIHAVMIRAEQAMRDELGRATLGTLAAGLARKAPPEFDAQARRWLAARSGTRDDARVAALKQRKRFP